MNWYLALIGAIFLTWVVVVALFTPRIDYKVHRRLDCSSKEFLHALHSTTQTTVHHDSHFEVLTNASQFYPAMLEAIHGAQASVDMECYMFRGDEIGKQFMAAMIDRAIPAFVGTPARELILEDGADKTVSIEIFSKAWATSDDEMVVTDAPR